MNKKILVIDDEPVVRRSFQLILEDTEYAVDEAETGEIGLTMAEKTNYDLIFLDLKMPGMNGVETLRALRKLPTVGAEVPVYIVTAFHKEFLEELKSAREDGITFQVLRKPCSAEEILYTVRGCLEGPVEVETGGDSDV